MSKTITTNVDSTGKKTQKVREESDGQVKEYFIEDGKERPKEIGK